MRARVKVTTGDGASKGSTGGSRLAPAADADVPSDADLLLAIAEVSAAGSDQAFATLLDRHLDRILMVARAVVRDESEAEDIAQETFLRLWQGAGRIEVGAGGAVPWLVRVARNLAIDRRRRERRVEVTDTPPDSGAPPDQLDRLVAGEEQGRIAEAVRGLPERQRTALLLFHQEELALADIGEAMGASAEAVESLLARARRSLRTLLSGQTRDGADGLPPRREKR
ncbi:MAG: sigma-70 family RNA polymerase sigma factor [Hyphomicrobiaceae bacterium]|nr:sigma-70 family RNA polymerase sigma factor [Hyphomicrobiaceae bacterium]